MDISPPAIAVHRQSFTIQCNASVVKSHLVEELMQYAKLEWLGPDGEVVASNTNIDTSETKVRNTLTGTLAFNPVLFRHEGQYTCRSKFEFSGGDSLTCALTSTRIDVIGKNKIKCLFNPLNACAHNICTKILPLGTMSLCVYYMHE